MNTREPEITIDELVTLPPLEQLERQWRELESRAEPSFFTSWSWIGCWLSCLPSHIRPRLLRAARGGLVVGLAVLVKDHFRRHQLLPVKGLFLHATGNQTFDTIAIEHNGFLVDKSTLSTVIPRLFDHIAAMGSSWDEFYLNGIDEATSAQFPAFTGLDVKKMGKCSFFVDLDAVRRADGNYLSLLGQNTRYNIRRSIKEYTKLGPLTLTVAKNTEEAFEYLAGLKRLHQSYWQSRDMPGAFANGFFESFHDKLIRSRFSSGEIQLIRVNAANQTLGYLYNFIHRGQVFNYQSGFNYTICEKKNRPGLVTHSLAIEFNATLGHSTYDLLAGESDYKHALSTGTAGMDWIVLQRDQIKFRVEDGLRNIKHKLRSVAGSQETG